MTPFARLTDWRRDAATRDLRVAAGTAALVLALLAWTLVPISRQLDQSVAFREAQQQAVAPPGQGAPNTIGSSPLTSDPIAGSAAAPGRGPVGGPAGRTTVPGTGGGLSATRNCGSLTASDQGVTSGEVRIAVADLDFDPNISEQFGFRKDAKAIVGALVDDINRHGGVACRKLVAKIYKLNPFVTENQRSSCLAATRDDRNFAFLDPGLLTTESTQSCVTVENKVPLIDASPWPASYARAQAPFFISYNTDADRAARNWVYAAKEAGFFAGTRDRPFKKLSLLVCDGDGGVTEELERDLAKVGVRSYVVRKLSCVDNLVAPPSQITQFAVQDSQDNVSHVFPATFSVNVENYLRAAKSQDFTPIYGASDLYNLTAPSFTEGFEASQWSGTVAYTATRSAELLAGIVAPETARCDAVLRAHGVDGIKTEWDDLARVYCDLLHMFTLGMSRAPTNPTRLGFAQAVRTIGRTSFSGGFDVIFDRPDKFSGGDFIRPLKWLPDPNCGKGDRRSGQPVNGCWTILDPNLRPAY